MEQPILQVEHLTKFFSVGPHAEVHAVDERKRHSGKERELLGC